MDPRPTRFLEKAEVAEEHRRRLQVLAQRAQELSEAKEAGKADYEFGADHVAIIHDCNQFLRAYKRGDAAGRIELRLDDEAKRSLQDAGVTLHEPQGQIFKLFGWVALDPMQAGEALMHEALEASFRAATG